MYLTTYEMPMNMYSTNMITSLLFNANLAEVNALKQYYQSYQNYSTVNKKNQLLFNWQNMNNYNNTIYSQNVIIKPTNRYFYTNNNNYNYQNYNNIFSSKPTINFTKNTTTNKTKSNNQETIQKDLRSEFLTTANKYSDCNEADGSWRKISNSKEWCADFITHVVNETYNNNGYSDLKGFNKKAQSPHMRVEEIKQWGINNKKFFDITRSSDKAETIKQNVEKGDIMILRENGSSHTGFVQQVYTDGSFQTIEGNRNDKVTTHTYQANDNRLSGFVQLA